MMSYIFVQSGQNWPGHPFKSFVDSVLVVGPYPVAFLALETRFRGVDLSR